MEDCRYCGSRDLATVLCAEGPHHARTFCVTCGRTLGWEAAPMNFARASTFVMPMGKHQGKTLAAIAASDAGLRYLDWLVGQEWLKPNIQRAVACYLAHPSIASEIRALVGDR